MIDMMYVVIQTHIIGDLSLPPTIFTPIITYSLGYLRKFYYNADEIKANALAMYLALSI